MEFVWFNAIWYLNYEIIIGVFWMLTWYKHKDCHRVASRILVECLDDGWMEGRMDGWMHRIYFYLKALWKLTLSSHTSQSNKCDLKIPKHCELETSGRKK
jgi:hypothetical protein